MKNDLTFEIWHFTFGHWLKTGNTPLGSLSRGDEGRNCKLKSENCQLNIEEGRQEKARAMYDHTRLYSLRYVRDMLDAHDIILKKSLGQNILFERAAVERLISAASVGPDDVVLEIGPGMGHLTCALLQRARHVVGIEIDRRMLPVLKGLLGGFPNFTLVHADVLKVDLAARFAELGMKPTCVVTNVPYYIATPILTHLVDSGLPLERVAMTLQTELARRYVAPPGSREYGSVTVAVSLWGNARVVCALSPRCFFPQPKVESAVLRIDLHQAPPVGIANPEFLRRVVRAAFSQRRKMLKNTLQPLAGAGFNVADAITAAGISPTVRAEQLALADFARLSDALLERMPTV